MANTYEVGKKVQHARDGRQGHIVEIDEAAGRARVKWDIQGNGMRTWVRFSDLQIMA